MKDIAVTLSNISKKYTLQHDKPTLAENLFLNRSQEDFWALKEINLTIKKGERVGIIGANGSGKTTLLKVITGITTPTSGFTNTVGNIVSLIELTAGFHPELTGEDNILLNGLLLGMSKNEIKSKVKRIIKFADIGKFIDTPFYTYSSGMALRLGFSIAIHANPDIIVIDEGLSFGDKFFVTKALKKIRDYIKKNKTLIFVSHFLSLVEQNCDRVIWLDKGTIKSSGEVNKVIKEYSRSIRSMQ